MTDQLGYNVSIGIITGIIAGILTIPLWALLISLYRRIRNRHIRKFWKPFFGKSISIIMTEYPALGNELSAKTAQVAAQGYLVSRGNAIAMSTLADFLAGFVTDRMKLTISGDKSGQQSNDSLVVIGSPANNLFSRMIFMGLENRFQNPLEIKHDDQTGEIWFQSKDGKKVFKPKIENGNGVDYAIVVRIKHRFHPCTVVLAGAYMFGVQAAANAVTNREILSYVDNATKSASDIMFLLKTDVINNHPGEPELEFDRDTYIYVLQRK